MLMIMIMILRHCVEWVLTFDFLRGGLKQENFKNCLPLIQFGAIYSTEDKKRKSHPKKQKKYRRVTEVSMLYRYLWFL